MKPQSRRRKGAPALYVSDSEDDEQRVGESAYNSLQLGLAIPAKECYVRALLELEQVVQQLHEASTKATQSLILADCYLAIQHCTESESHMTALSRLMAACARQLPKTKKESFIREYRQVSIQLKRRARKDKAVIQLNEPSRADALNLDVLTNVFKHLLPPDLASASCVCKLWSYGASSNLLWDQFLPVNFTSKHMGLPDLTDYKGEPPFKHPNWKRMSMRQFSGLKTLTSTWRSYPRWWRPLSGVQWMHLHPRDLWDFYVPIYSLALPVEAVVDLLSRNKSVSEFRPAKLDTDSDSETYPDTDSTVDEE